MLLVFHGDPSSLRGSEVDSTLVAQLFGSLSLLCSEMGWGKLANHHFESTAND